MSAERCIVNFKSNDGENIPCQVLDIFELMGCEYALLIKVTEEMLVIMRTVARDDATEFQTIESQEEYDRVVEHIQMMAKMNAD